ncbi:MAG: peptide chain release factor-like protein [Thermodesulfobacteriota bacterium]
MGKFAVRPEKERVLLERMKKLRISEGDLAESFVSSGGPGGQNVNRTATCVVLKHLPTGVVVKAQRERTQSLNRFLARRMLVERIERLELGEDSPEEKRREKLRKRKNRRRRRAKAKHSGAARGAEEP